jgi:hypothetical protein
MYNQDWRVEARHPLNNQLSGVIDMPAKNDTTKSCSLPDCDRQYYARGYCGIHYHRLMRSGEIKATHAKIHGDDNARFDSYVHLIPFSTCHYWVGSLSPAGYGRIGVADKKLQAHRFAYERAKGPIPDGMYVLHSCHTPACVNPDHLRVGTQKMNMQDMVDAGRQSRQKGSACGRAKLTEADVIEIREDPRIQREIAADYGVNTSTIGFIKTRRSWGHV